MMKQNIILFLVTILLSIFVIEVSLRFADFKEAYFGEEKFLYFSKPDSFIVKDNILGFRLGTGEFTFFHKDSVYFQCRINAKRNRIINQSDVSLKYKES